MLGPVAKRFPKVHRVKYRGYRGEATYDPETGLLKGHVVNLRKADMVLFHGATPAELQADLAGQIDFYEKTLRKHGRGVAPAMLTGPLGGASILRQ
jgi:predicted HicB family RNase H-like nuclease